VSRLPRLATFFLPLILLAGCSHAIKLPLLGTIDDNPPPSRDAALKRLKNATPCCRAWADLPFHDALPAQPREFTLDKFSPVAELDGEPTHFLTFVLPKYKKPYRVVFQAQPSARHLDSSFLLAPTVTLLNADYTPLSSTNVTLCVYINWRPSMSGGFGAVKIDDPNAQYLVISTSKKQLAATTYWAQSPTSFSDVNVPSGSAMAGIKVAAPVTSGSYDVPHGPEGTLYLGKMTPAYASAVDNGLCGKPSSGQGLLPELRHALQNR
jgi:maltose operon protein